MREPDGSASERHKIRINSNDQAQKSATNFQSSEPGKNRFSGGTSKKAEDAFSVAVQVSIGQMIIVKMPPHVKNSVEKAEMESGVYEQTVTDLGWELHANSLEAPAELQMHTVTQHATKLYSDTPQQTCYKKTPGHQTKLPSAEKREKTN